MTFGEALPWWGAIIALVALVLVAVRAYSGLGTPLAPARRAALVALRAAVLILLGVLWLRPLAVVPSAGEEAVVPVLVDTSRSMGIADAAGARRIDRAMSLARDRVLPQLAGRFRPVILTFADGLSQPSDQAVSPGGRRTDLAGAVRAARDRFRDQPIAGFVVVSDGADSSGEDPVRAVSRAGGPVFTVGVGTATLPDREVASVTVRDAGLPRSTATIDAAVVSRGLGPAPFDVRLFAGGQLVTTRRLTPAADATPTLASFVAAPADAAAPTTYTVEIPPAPGEAVVENNRRSVVMDPPARPRRILFVQGAPGFDHSFLRRAWALDPGLEVDAVVREGTDDRGQPTFGVQAPAVRGAALSSGYPGTRAALFAYDAVVFANARWDDLTRDQRQMTADFVARRGGGLLVVGAGGLPRADPAGDPLREVLPLGSGEAPQVPGASSPADATPAPAARGLQLRLTSEGRTHPATRIAMSAAENERRWDHLPPLAGLAAPGAPGPGASVLAVAGDGLGHAQPLVAVQRYGRGRSLIFAGDGAWRWRMLLPADDHTYEEIWRQALRWVAAGAPDPVTVRAAGRADPGEAVTLEVSVAGADFVPAADASVTIEVTSPGGETRVVPALLADAGAGRYAARVALDAAGLYRVTARARRGNQELGSGESAILAGGADDEFADPRVNLAGLSRLSAATGGRRLAVADIDHLAGALTRGPRLDAPPAERDLWHSPWTFGLVAGLVCGEWILRRRWGLC